MIIAEEEERLLIKDLCARLPYGVIIDIKYNKEHGSSDRLRICSEGRLTLNTDLVGLYIVEEIYLKPYLRPLSSMTVEEGERLEQIAKETLGDFMFRAEEDGGAIYHMDKWKALSPAMFDYLNSIHIDYRGLIGMGLALPAPEGMYDKCETLNV